MSNTIDTVVLIPPEGDPHGLLMPGAPVMLDITGDDYWVEGWVVDVRGRKRVVAHHDVVGVDRLTLVPRSFCRLRLVQRGQVVPEGVDRASRCGYTFYEGELERRLKRWLKPAHPERSSPLYPSEMGGTVLCFVAAGGVVQP